MVAVSNSNSSSSKARIVQKKSQRMVAIVVEDDPQTREPVHRAITITMEAYAMVLVTTPKQTRDELSVDGMHMLVQAVFLR
jgi:hypothetical protein